ncbi:MAG: cytochrome c peroxidase [Candidatus Hydrogenedentes bacterium]|jgi:cytochrome c peroxidase|nr:cytochrome c peroxidase [Candidatus Hydrogenedentota bacterium]
MYAFCALLIALLSFPARAQEETNDVAPSLRLGERLFVDIRFTNPASNFAGSCRACHRPYWAREGKRAYSDSSQYSLIPTNSRRRKVTTTRNVPSLMDVAHHGRFNHDGSSMSLEETIAAEFQSLHLGWLPDEGEIALEQIQMVLLYDGGVDKIAEGTYVEQFNSVYGIDLEAMGRDETVEWVIKCLADYVSSLKSTRTSSYDAFVYMNRLRQGPQDDESPQTFGESQLARLANLEGRTGAKIHTGFSDEAYEGYKIFMRTSGAIRTGNCVACHHPPLFSDGLFHNTGVAQAEYDATNGLGSFGQIAVPEAADALRPAVEFGPKLEGGKQVNADLGYWNYAEPGEEGASFLDAAIGAFKTPTLRNLEHTDPYMHDGAYATLEEAIAQKVRACLLAKSRALRNGDSAMSVMNISDEDIAPLSAFLATLNDLSVEEFEEHRRTGRSLADSEGEH